MLLKLPITGARKAGIAVRYVCVSRAGKTRDHHERVHVVKMRAKLALLGGYVHLETSGACSQRRTSKQEPVNPTCIFSVLSKNQREDYK